MENLIMESVSKNKETPESLDGAGGFGETSDEDYIPSIASQGVPVNIASLPAPNAPKLDWALYWHSRGFYIFPTWGTDLSGNCDCGDSECASISKDGKP